MNRFIEIIKELNKKYLNLDNIIFILAVTFLLVLVFLGFPFLILLCNRCATDWLTAFMTYYLVIATICLAVITAVVIIRQSQQLRKQLELQVITDLYREWNDKDMLIDRCKLCKKLPIDDIDNDTLIIVENVIEFLERIASYYKNEVLSKGLLWDTFSFYISRYYFYTQKAIPAIEERWGHDRTLYLNLKELYNDMMEVESSCRRISKEEIQKHFEKEIEFFRSSECYVSSQNC